MRIVKYLSTDKLYNIKLNKISEKGKIIIFIIFSILLFLLSIIFLNLSINNKGTSLVSYSEDGNVDYKIYLKDNNYYDTSYLEKDMQYVASLIKTVNVRFDYQIHANKDIQFAGNYKVIADLQITEKNDPSKLLYSKKEELISNKKVNIIDNNFVINEEFDIDYGKYNNIVNSYKRDYGLTVSSNLILTFELDNNGKYNKTHNIINKSNQMQIVIPLSEQTINITINTNEIKNSGKYVDTNRTFKLNILFIIFIVLSLLTIACVVVSVYLLSKYLKKDIYKNKVNKLLRDYDRIIVNGKINIDESKFNNKIYPESFEEMVDAAQTLEVPIYYYEAIKNEKCFFVIVKDNTLYKYRLTRAFLEKNPNNKKEKLIEEDK